MKKRSLVGLITGLFLVGMVGVASATTVDLFGSRFIQEGSVFNDSGLVMTDFIYSFGTAEDYIATWDSRSTPAGSTLSDMFGASWAQTVTWSGLNVASGTSWNFSGLDIDMITNAANGSVSGGILDRNGSYNSLRNASVTVIYSNGSSEFANLIGNAGWQGEHDYVLRGSGHAPVPEPATMLLFGTGLAGLAGLRRRQGRK